MGGLTPKTAGRGEKRDERQQLYKVHGWRETEFAVYAKTPSEALGKVKRGLHSRTQEHPNFDDVTIWDSKNQVVFKSSNVVKDLREYLEARLRDDQENKALGDALNKLKELTEKE